MKERDRLLAQTLAFVQGVAAQRPVRDDGPASSIAESCGPEQQAADILASKSHASEFDVPFSAVEIAAPRESAPPLSQISSQAPVVIDAASCETDLLISLMALTQSEQRRDQIVLPPDRMAMPELPHPIEVETQKRQPRPHVKPPIEMELPERDVIAQRVARFRASQQKLIQSRDDNYALVQAKIRATLGKNPSA